jgi:acyl carrier protein
VFGEAIAFDPSLERLDEPSWTSLKHVELIIALEREFGVRFDGADAIDMTSIPTIVERVERELRWH